MRAALMPILLVFASLASPAVAEQTSRLPSIDELSALTPLSTPAADRPYSAVGRLDTGVGFCTGALIASDLVLTAAHCLFDAQTGERLPLGPMGFNAALTNGRAVAQRGVRRAVLMPDYEFGTANDLGRIQSDIALIVLDRAISQHEADPIPADGLAAPGDSVQLVSYGENREDHASLEDDCSVMAGQDRVQVLSCHVDRGSSGAPVMELRGGRRQIVAVVSARAIWRGQPVALAATLDGNLPTLLDLLDRTDGVFSQPEAAMQTVTGPVTGMPTVRADDGGRSSIAARFVRVNP